MDSPLAAARIFGLEQALSPHRLRTTGFPVADGDTGAPTPWSPLLWTVGKLIETDPGLHRSSGPEVVHIE